MSRPVCADCQEEGRDGCYRCGLRRPTGKPHKLIPVPTEWADVAMLLHEAVVHGRTRSGKVVYGRRRPHVPHGDDPGDVNRECARRYVVRFSPRWTDRAVVTEVDPADVVPFIDIAAALAAADIRCNAAQRTNVKPDGSGSPK